MVPWRGINDPLMECDVVNFPYAVLEVKLVNTEAGPPEWIDDLLSGDYVMRIQNFSKFLHGTAKLHREATKEVPSWFTPKGAETTSPIQLEIQQQAQPQQQEQQQQHQHQQGVDSKLQEVQPQVT